MDATHILCHRCSTALPEGVLFCTECGSPQLVLTETDAQRVIDERAAMVEGDTPVLRASAVGRIRWRPVLHILTGLVMITGVMTAVGDVVPGLGFLHTVLVLLGATFAIQMYQRRVPGATMSGGVGARIGAVLGVMLAVMVTAVNEAFVLIYRYAMHNSAQMDQKINDMMQDNMKLAMATYPSLYPNPQQMGPVLQYFQSADGHATLALGAAGLIAAVTLVYSAFSGALWGWWAGARVKA